MFNPQDLNLGDIVLFSGYTDRETGLLQFASAAVCVRIGKSLSRAPVRNRIFAIDCSGARIFCPVHVTLSPYNYVHNICYTSKGGQPCAAGSHVWRRLGELSMKDLMEQHIFIKAFSIHLLFSRDSEKFWKDCPPWDEKERYMHCCAGIFPCSDNSWGCPEQHCCVRPALCPGELALPLSWMDEGESRSVLMQQDCFSCKS